LNTLDFQPGVLEEIQEGMCGVTTNKDLGTAYIRFGDPTGEYAPQAPYSVCGKTGTAQTAQFPNAWFIAYAPAEDPQIAIAVVVEQSLEGSQVSAPIIRRILDDYFGVFRAPFPSWWNDDFPFTPLDTPEGEGSG
jgi:cell division protein FtsI/penicillin-binding protein 2